MATSHTRAEAVAAHVDECIEIARRITAADFPIGGAINPSELVAATILALAIHDLADTLDIAIQNGAQRLSP